MNRCKPERHERVRENVLQKSVSYEKQRCWIDTQQDGKSRECMRMRGELEVGSFMAQEVLWNIAKKRTLEDR